MGRSMTAAIPILRKNDISVGLEWYTKEGVIDGSRWLRCA